MFETTAGQDLDQFEADFALGGEVEFDEEDEEYGLDLEMLVAGVRGARRAGA